MSTKGRDSHQESFDVDDSQLRQIRITVLEKTLSYCAGDYSILERSFSSLDAKAQATFAVAGIFLALNGAFVTNGNLSTVIQKSYIAVVFLFVTLIALVGSTLLCIVAMRIRRIPTPLEGETLSEVVEDVLDSEEDPFSFDVYEGWFREQIAAWEEPLKGMRRVNEEKAAWILRAQSILIIAIVSAASLAVTFVLLV